MNDDVKTIRASLLCGEEQDTSNAREALNRVSSHIAKLEYHNSILKKALGTLLEIEGGGFSSDYLYEQSMLHGGRND